MAYARYRHGGRDLIGLTDGSTVAPVAAASLVEALSRRPAADEAARVPIGEVELLPAYDPPAKVLCVALNYVDHAKEAAQPVPATPIVFFKSAEAMIGAGARIQAPEVVRQLDYEGELAIVIGEGGFAIAREDAWRHVAGVTAFNDTSSRDLLKVKAGEAVHLDWFSAKCLERSTPVGPAVVPLAEMRDALEVRAVRVRTRVNGEVRQDAPIADMIFDIPTVVAFASSRVSLRPGDVIATGTPPGVGFATGRFLSPGDVVEVDVTGVPTLRNVVA